MGSESITAFYNSIIEQEKKKSSLKEEKLSAAMKAIGFCYSKHSLERGLAYIDYDDPYKRCAYLYKFGILHTGMVMKYFNKVLKKGGAKKIGNSVKICCLGGGPGTDVVAILKVLARYPRMHQAVKQITILDICGGWRNSFNQVISRLTSGKLKDVPSTFFDIENLKVELKYVDLLKPLSQNIKQIISEASVVCMVKFVSAIIGKPGAVDALIAITEAMKLNAVVLFIDNYQGKIYENVRDIFVNCGLNLILGPIHEAYVMKQSVSANILRLYKKPPLQCTKVSVMGFFKGIAVTQISLTSTANQFNLELLNKDDDNWETDNSDNLSEIEADEISSIEGTDISYPIIKNYYLKKDKSTQTVVDINLATTVTKLRDNVTSFNLNDICQLLNGLNNLLLTVKRIDSSSNADTSTNQCCKSKVMSDKSLLLSQSIQQKIEVITSLLLPTE